MTAMHWILVVIPSRTWRWSGLWWPVSCHHCQESLISSLEKFTKFTCGREIHSLDPQPHRHSMLVPRVCAPRVTRCSLGKYWSHDFFQKEAESSRQGVGNPEPYLFSLPLSRSDRLPRRWGQQAARLGYTGYLWLMCGRQRNLMMHAQCPLPVYYSQLVVTSNAGTSNQSIVLPWFFR